MAVRAGYGEILGTAAASADCALNAWPSDPEPLVRTMSLALEDAGLAASDVDVVYASANATARLDEVEARALVTLFGGSRTIVTSIKGAIGECGASSAAACVAAVLCGAAGRVPPIAGLREPDPITGPLRLADANMAGAGRDRAGQRRRERRERSSASSCGSPRHVGPSCNDA